MKATEVKKLLNVTGTRTGYYGIKASKDSGGLKVSTLTGKLEGMHSISTSPELSHFCQTMHHCPGTICEKCFSCRSVIPEEGGYKQGLRAALAHNTAWLSVDHEIEDFPVLNDLYHRIESHGDVDTVIQAVNFIKLVLRNPETHFTAWTKNAVAWDKAFKQIEKPDNLIMVYSSPVINHEISYEKISKYFPWIDKVFTVFSAEYLAEHEDLIPTINCGSKQCLACMLCYRKNNVRQVRELLK